MKRFFILGALLGLFFASCSYNASDYSQAGSRSKQKNDDEELQLFSFVLDNDFVSTVQKSSGISKLNSVTVRIEFTGGYEATDTKNLSFSELLGTSFNFTGIPLNKAFTVKILVYHGSVLKYEAIKENIILEKGGENDLSMVLKSVFDFADETKNVVWNCQNDNYSLYALNSASDSLGSPFATDLNNKNFFFDAPGNVWYQISEETPNGHEIKLKSDKGKEIAFSDIADFNDASIRSFTCSRESNALYVIAVKYGEESSGGAFMTSVVYKFPTLLTDSSKKYTKYILSIENSQGESMVDWPAVYFDGTDEKLYGVFRGMDGSALLEFNLTGKEDGASVTGTEKLNLSNEIDNVEHDGYLQVYDLICHEGLIYILVNGRAVESDLWTKNNYGTDFKSRGFLLKFDISTGAVTTMGFSTDTITGSDYEKMYCFSSDGKMGYKVDNNEEAFLIEGDKDLTFSAKINTLFPSMISPSSISGNTTGNISTTKFYGPSKIIGLKPKKLVIADDGYAFYVDENGAPAYKNVNRIVTVDLESFAISDSKNTSVNFDRDISLLKMYSGSDSYSDASLGKLGDGSLFYSNTNVYVGGTPSPITSVYLGLRNADSE